MMAEEIVYFKNIGTGDKWAFVALQPHTHTRLPFHHVHYSRIHTMGNESQRLCIVVSSTDVCHKLTSLIQVPFVSLSVRTIAMQCNAMRSTAKVISVPFKILHFY